MADTLARAALAAVLAGLALNTWLLWGASSRVDALTARVATLEAVEPRPAPSVVRFDPVPTEVGVDKRRPRKARRKGGKARSELTEQEKLARFEERFDSAEEVLVEFADDQAMTTETFEQVLDEIHRLHESVLDVRRDVQDDQLTVSEGRKQARQLREDSDLRLTKLLTVEQVAMLRQRLADRPE